MKTVVKKIKLARKLMRPVKPQTKRQLQEEAIKAFESTKQQLEVWERGYWIDGYIFARNNPV